jgi:CRISPR/Cas system CMR-associated protein Cmr3 (group 5 of RAMP superfamily)
MGPEKAKKQKMKKKEYNCTLCKVSVTGNGSWLSHLNGKRHRNTLTRLAKLEMKKKVSSDIDKKRTPNIGLAAVKMEMDNDDSLDATGERLQTDKRIVKKMHVSGISTTSSKKKKKYKQSYSMGYFVFQNIDFNIYLQLRWVVRCRGGRKKQWAVV